jgi:molybdopterin converting factor small subunit
MKIRVKVDSNLRIKNVFEPPLELEMSQDENTLKDVLGKLSEQYPYLRFLAKGEMGDDPPFTCTLNGESHFSFPEGLNRKITEGDTVRVDAYMDPLAGG